MSRYFIFSLAIAICFVTIASSQTAEPGDFGKDTGDVLLNQQLMIAALQENLEEQAQDPENFSGPQKSIGKAVLFSAAVPGAGQLYAGSYLKSALFLAIEATAWAINISYNNKGDNQTRIFESYANKNWSEQRYWSFVYFELNGKGVAGFPDGKYDSNIGKDGVGRDIILNWEDAEQDLQQFASTQYISGFSHHLPETKTQQYYEMIGKYPEQFGNAWADGSYNVRYNGDYGGVTVANLTPMTTEYVFLRDDANRFYDKAGYGSMIALINHLVSAIDAGFTTRGFNQKQMKLTYQNRLLVGDYINMFGLSVAF